MTPDSAPIGTPPPSAETDATLGEFLAARARRSTDTRLAVDVAVGVVVTVATILWRGRGWYMVLSAALCFLAYGVWGIADRELLERTTVGSPGLRGLRAARVVAVLVGAAAAVFLIVASLGIALGTVKS